MPYNFTDSWLVKGEKFMSIAINTHFVPFKLDLQEKKPVRMDVEVVNRYLEPKKVRVEIIAGNQLGLNKTIAAKENFEIGLLSPGETKTIQLDVFPKNYSVKGEEKIGIIATEITIEQSGYAYPSKKFKKIVELQIK